MDLDQALATYPPSIEAEMREVLAIPQDVAAGQFR